MTVTSCIRHLDRVTLSFLSVSPAFPRVSALERKKRHMTFIQGTHWCMISLDKCSRSCVKGFIALFYLILQSTVKYTVMINPIFEVRNWKLSTKLWSPPTGPGRALSQRGASVRHCPRGAVSKQGIPACAPRVPQPLCQGVSPPDGQHSLPVCLFLISIILHIVTLEYKLH